MHSADFISEHGEGWRVINHGVVAPIQDSDDFLMVTTLERDVSDEFPDELPDSLML